MNKRFLLLIITVCTIHGILAQSISGRVISSDTKEPLPFAHVTFGEYGVITNIEGEFIIQLDRHISNELTVSYMGFDTYIQVLRSSPQPLRIELEPSIVELEQVTVITANNYIADVIGKFPLNYSYNHLLYNAYYKEKLDSSGVVTYLGEGILNIYRPSDVSSNEIVVSPERVRKYISSEANENARVKGHASDMVQSVIWRKNSFLQKKEINNYDFFYSNDTRIGDRKVKVLQFEPKTKKGRYVGKVYIDKHSDAVIKTEYEPIVKSSRHWESAKWEEEFTFKNGTWNLSRCLYSGEWSDNEARFTFEAHLVINRIETTGVYAPDMENTYSNTDCFVDAINDFSEDFWELNPHMKLQSSENPNYFLEN